MSGAGRTFVTCPQCRLPNPIGPTHCWSCGAPLPAASPPPLAQATSGPGETTPAEGRWAYGAQETPSSGYAYSVPGTTASTPAYTGGAPSRGDRWIYVMLGIAVAVLVGVLAVLAAASLAAH